MRTLIHRGRVLSLAQQLFLIWLPGSPVGSHQASSRSSRCDCIVHISALPFSSVRRARGPSSRLLRALFFCSRQGIPMNQATWWQRWRSALSLSSAETRRQRRRAPSLRLEIEALEERVLLSGVPTPAHVVWVIEENHSFSEIIGNPSAPYIN